VDDEGWEEVGVDLEAELAGEEEEGTLCGWRITRMCGNVANCGRRREVGTWRRIKWCAWGWAGCEGPSVSECWAGTALRGAIRTEEIHWPRRWGRPDIVDHEARNGIKLWRLHIGSKHGFGRSIHAASYLPSRVP